MTVSLAESVRVDTYTPCAHNTGLLQIDFCTLLESLYLYSSNSGVNLSLIARENYPVD